MNSEKIWLAIGLAVVLSACDSSPSTDLKDSIVETTSFSNFDPANSVVPFPNDVLFSGTLDGTVNIPVADANDFSDPQVAINALDGFSTVAPISTGFTDPIDASSIDGDSVRLYQVTLSASGLPNNQGGAVVAINSQLTYGVDYVAALSSVDATGSTLVILPLQPLDPASSYYVVITDDLQGEDGNPVSGSLTYYFTQSTTALEVGGVSQVAALTDAQAVALEPLRQLTSTGEATLFAFAPTLSSEDIVLSWSFTTQSIGAVLSAVRASVGAVSSTLAASTVNVGAGAGLSPLGAANVYEGTLDNIPYYLTQGTPDPTAILDEPWQAATAVAGENNLTGANPLPAETARIDIPLMVTTPVDTVTFPAPWRTVIYQHGITRKRSDVLAVADSLAQAGFAVVAIDLPLHGEAPTSAFYQSGAERTFDVDLVGQDVNGSIISVGPDTVTDSSGAHYINLSNLLVSRDNLRQGIADLFALTAAIPSMDVDGGGADLANGATAGEIYLVSHSLGAIVGVPFHALETNVKDGVFANGGGGIPKILDGSASFGPVIAAGLAANGVVKGTADFESFLGAAQTVIDDGDPLNYAATDAARGEGILHMLIVGDGAGNPSDLTVPITVPDANDTTGTVAAPLAGGLPLANLLGLQTVTSTQTSLMDGLVVTQFNDGLHSSFIDPTSDPAVTTEMQSQMATFLATDGDTLSVGDGSLLSP